MTMISDYYTQGAQSYADTMNTVLGSNLDIGQIAENLAHAINFTSGNMSGLFNILGTYLIGSSVLSIKNKIDNKQSILHSFVPLGLGGALLSGNLNITDTINTLIPHAGMI